MPMDVRGAYVSAMRERADELAENGVVAQGAAFSPLLLLCGASPDEGKGLLAKQVETALRAAFNKLGYAPEDWCVLSSAREDGASLSPSLLRLAITALDPTTLVAVDEVAANDLREAYATELSELDDLSQAMLEPGTVVRLLGMRVMALGDFAGALEDPSGRAKQRMWARLKQLPPLGEPY